MNYFPALQRVNALLRAAALGSALLLVHTLASAQPAGVIDFARGVGFVQSAGQAPRIMGKGLELQEGDKLTTAEGSLAVIKMLDGTRMTVRPNSLMVIQQYKYEEKAKTDNRMVMHLVKGGFRALTGAISKDSPNAARVITNTATIGIRGTDFDARLCTTECKAESDKVTEKPRQNMVSASAKAVSVQGEASATDAAGAKRKLVTGTSVYSGETVETGAASELVLAFRDGSRTTLGSATRMRVDNFAFEEQNPKEGRFGVSLLKGSMRALTGLIGKANNRNVGFNTPTATIGIRGTGLDLDCGADAKEDSCSFYTWLGTIEVTPLGQSEFRVLEAGQGLFVSPSGIRPLSAPILQNLPRPDSVPVDTKQLFSASAVDDAKEGLFVFVRDGHIEVTTASETLHLGRGETGFAGNDGITARPIVMPLFIEFDRTPMPSSKTPMTTNVLDESGARQTNQCK
jgi:hypothetical protein